MNIPKVINLLPRIRTDNIWEDETELFSLSTIGQSVKAFSSYNLHHHAELAHYYTPNGYLVKFCLQVILRCTIEVNTAYNERKTTYSICLSNINCRSLLCCRANGSIIVHHNRSTVTRVSTETNNSNDFQQEFFYPLRDFIKENKDLGWERVQRMFCKDKAIWVNTTLMKKLYFIFNDGQIHTK